MNNQANSWIVSFETRNRRRNAALAYIVQAPTQAEALNMGIRLLRMYGESTLSFKRPTCRQLSDEEQLAATA